MTKMYLTKVTSRLRSIAMTALIVSNAAQAQASTCYSRFSPLEKREFKAAFTPSLRELMDKATSDYANGAGDVNIPLASDGNLYLASTCDYVLLLRRGLDERVAFTAISRSEYDRVVALASESGRVIRMEPP